MAEPQDAPSVSVYGGKFTQAKIYNETTPTLAGTVVSGDKYIMSGEYFENNHLQGSGPAADSTGRIITSERYHEKNEIRNFYKGLSIAGVCLLIVVISCAFAFHGYFASPTIRMGVEHPTDDLTTLLNYTVTSALHNSGDRFDPPRCHPETRVVILEEIKEWAGNALPSFSPIHLLLGSPLPPPPPPILWLHGSAGTGKSAIAQTLAELWHHEGKLAASFFFSRSIPRRNEKSFVISTIAYQLLQSFPELETGINEALRKDPLIFHKSLQAQLALLISRPLEDLYDYTPTSANIKLVIIDGLDEIVKPEQQTELLNTLGSAILQQSLPLRLLVTSRPEPHISSVFDLPNFFASTARFDLNERQDVDRDIEVYLHDRFSSIKENTDYSWPTKQSWPASDVIPTLVERAAGLFVYASVVMDYLTGQDTRPDKLLDVVMEVKTNPASIHNPFGALDAMYKQILSSLSNSTLETAKDVLAHILSVQQCSQQVRTCTCGPYGDCQPWYYWENPAVFPLDKLLFLDDSERDGRLRGLHSVIKTDENHFPLTNHKSFLDFVTDPSRAGSFHLDNGHVHARASLLYLKHLFVRLTLPPGEIFASYTSPERMPGDLSCSLKLAKADEALERGVLAVIQPEEKHYYEYLKSIDMDHLEPRRNLEVIPTSGKREMIQYLSKCNDERDQPFYQRLITKAMLQFWRKSVEEEAFVLWQRLDGDGYWNENVRMHFESLKAFTNME